MIRRLQLILPLLGLLAGPLHAQRIVGQLLDPAEGPVIGAFVRLMGGDGTYLGGVITDAEGRFTLQAPKPGTYRVLAERIGYESVEAGPFEVGAGATVPVQLQSGMRAIALEGLDVSGERRCTTRRDRAQGAARVWEEARKALEVTLWAKENAEVQFRGTVYHQQLAPDLEVLDQTAQTFFGASYRTFITADPGLLEEFGYARADGDSIEYYGLDAEVLLSDHFLDLHCFELTESPDDPAYVGLSFKPVQDRGLPDLEGTLWVERATGRLRDIEYRWVSMYRVFPAMTDAAPPPAGVPPIRMTGKTAFRQLENGIWIVDDWWIRVPVLVWDRHAFRIDGWRVRGGLVLNTR